MPTDLADLFRRVEALEQALEEGDAARSQILLILHELAVAQQVERARLDRALGGEPDSPPRRRASQVPH